MLDVGFCDVHYNLCSTRPTSSLIWCSIRLSVLLTFEFNALKIIV